MTNDDLKRVMGAPMNEDERRSIDDKLVALRDDEPITESVLTKQQLRNLLHMAEVSAVTWEIMGQTAEGEIKMDGWDDEKHLHLLNQFTREQLVVAAVRFGAKTMREAISTTIARRFEERLKRLTDR